MKWLWCLLLIPLFGYAATIDGFALVGTPKINSFTHIVTVVSNTITVTGAGVAGVNGTYKYLAGTPTGIDWAPGQEGWTNTLNNNLVIFYSAQNHGYYLQTKLSGGFFYGTSVETEDLEGAWVRKNPDGVAPAPTVLFNRTTNDVGLLIHIY